VALHPELGPRAASRSNVTRLTSRSLLPHHKKGASSASGDNSQQPGARAQQAAAMPETEATAPGAAIPRATEADLTTDDLPMEKEVGSLQLRAGSKGPADAVSSTTSKRKITSRLLLPHAATSTSPTTSGQAAKKAKGAIASTDATDVESATSADSADNAAGRDAVCSEESASPPNGDEVAEDDAMEVGQAAAVKEALADADAEAVQNHEADTNEAAEDSDDGSDVEDDIAQEAEIEERLTELRAKYREIQAEYKRLDRIDRVIARKQAEREALLCGANSDTSGRATPQNEIRPGSAEEPSIRRSTRSKRAPPIPKAEVPAAVEEPIPQRPVRVPKPTAVVKAAKADAAAQQEKVVAKRVRPDASQTSTPGAKRARTASTKAVSPPQKKAESSSPQRSSEDEVDEIFIDEHGNKTYKCRLCSREFTHPPAYAQHKRSHEYDDANKDEGGKEDSSKKKAAPSAEKKQPTGTRSRVRRVKGGGR